MAYTTISKSSDHFSSNIYTGTGSSQTIVTGHQSDLIWIKQRTTVRPNVWFDSVNSSMFASSNSKYLVSNTDAALTSNNSTQLTANSSTGFTLGSDNSDQINKNGDTAVAHSWKANGQGSSNTDGSINSTYTSANTTSKFSIVTYTGTGSNATVGHGLGVVPQSIWLKCTSNAGEDWMVYHHNLGATHYLTLNGSGGDNSGGEVIWNDTVPTSSVFSIGTNGKVNTSGRTYVAYCFAEVQGFSKIGRYTGNGQADGDGIFIYTGFKPAWIMFKKSDGAANWWLFDSARDPHNQASKVLLPDNTAAETSTSAKYFDILSNGFKLRSSEANWNGSGNGYVYWSFAEEPLVASNNVAATAR